MNHLDICRTQILLMIVIGLMAGSISQAQTITTKEIEQIRARSVLTEKDLAAVATFVNEHLIALMTAADKTDLQDLNEATAVLNENTKSRATHSEPTMTAYSQQYNAVIQKVFPHVMDFANTLKDPVMGQQLQLAMMSILVQTDNSDLIQTFIAQLGHKDPAIRYWAAKGLAGPAIIQLISQPESANPAPNDFWKGLTACLEKETEPAVISQLVRTAALAPGDKAIELIRKAIAKRLPLYRNWTVDHEYIDFEIIRICSELALTANIQSNETLRNDLMKSAIELYVAGYYRYAKGTQHDVGQGKTVILLTPQSLEYMQTVLVEGELILTRTASRIDPTVRPAGSRFLKLLQSPQPQLDRAYQIVMPILNKTFSLFPDQAGPNPTYFDPLPDPPGELVQSAITRSEIQNKILETDF